MNFGVFTGIMKMTDIFFQGIVCYDRGNAAGNMAGFRRLMNKGILWDI